MSNSIFRTTKRWFVACLISFGLGIVLLGLCIGFAWSSMTIGNWAVLLTPASMSIWITSAGLLLIGAILFRISFQPPTRVFEGRVRSTVEQRVSFSVADGRVNPAVLLRATKTSDWRETLRRTEESLRQEEEKTYAAATRNITSLAVSMGHLLECVNKIAAQREQVQDDLDYAQHMVAHKLFQAKIVAGCLSHTSEEKQVTDRLERAHQMAKAPLDTTEAEIDRLQDEIPLSADISRSIVLLNNIGFRLAKMAWSIARANVGDQARGLPAQVEALIEPVVNLLASMGITLNAEQTRLLRESAERIQEGNRHTTRMTTSVPERRGISASEGAQRYSSYRGA